MTVRIAQLVRTYHDVVNEAFLRDFPGIEVAKAHSADELAAALEGAEILHVYNSGFTPEVGKAVRQHGTALRWIQFTTVGVDIAEENGLIDGVWVTNIGDVRQRVLAGHAVALMLGVMRGFAAYAPHRAARDWAREKMFPHMIAPEGGTMVLCGMGRIGQDIARKAKAFDMEVICVTRAARPASPSIDRVVPRGRLREVLPAADVVMIAMPLDDETRHFIGAAELALMKETAVLINISRGAVVDEAALAEALAAGRLRGAGLDVFETEPLPASSPLWDLPNAILTPHLGGQGGAEQWHRLSELVRDNTRRYLAGEPLLNVVIAPAGAAPRAANREQGR
jgi:phosphoglycerate dehydrogenase-like enzyme